ncbi:Uncharacterised protein [uncultured archaeon]|nr:Uncharacterised protein [uncultured archaeon]
MIETFTIVFTVIALLFALIFFKLLYDIKKIEKEDVVFLKKEVESEEEKLNDIEKKILKLDKKLEEKASVQLVKTKLEELQEKIKRV